MSKKRLYEIAKEIGKESKEVVSRAKELGIDVKSHSSSVELDVASRIAASFSDKPTKNPKVEQNEEHAPKAALKEETKKEGTPEKDESVVAPAKKPQSRNFKAEREARAKEQAERRNKRNKQQGGQKKREETPRREERQAGSQRNPQVAQKEQRQRNERRDSSQRRPKHQQRPAQQGPRIDFKARAAALKAEQNAEYARSSEERFKQAQEARKIQETERKQRSEEKRLAQAAEILQTNSSF